MRTEFNLRINLRAVLRPVCWVTRHVWRDFTGNHVIDRSGRSCSRCRKVQYLVHEFLHVEDGVDESGKKRWILCARTTYPNGRVTEMWPGENKYRLIREGRG